MMFSKEFVQLLFFRGEFTEFDVQRTGEVVFFYSLGLLFYSIKGSDHQCVLCPAGYQDADHQFAAGDRA